MPFLVHSGIYSPEYLLLPQRALKATSQIRRWRGVERQHVSLIEHGVAYWGRPLLKVHIVCTLLKPFHRTHSLRDESQYYA